eukprot:gene39650-40987_t
MRQWIDGHCADARQVAVQACADTEDADVVSALMALH